jgi:hypothetical protein
MPNLGFIFIQDIGLKGIIRDAQSRDNFTGAIGAIDAPILE